MQFKTERSDFSGYSHAPSKMSKATAIAFDTLLVWEAELAAGGVFSSGAICAKHLGTPALRVWTDTSSWHITTSHFKTGAFSEGTVPSLQATAHCNKKAKPELTRTKQS